MIRGKESEMNSNKSASPVTQDQKIFVLVHGGAQGAWAFGKLAWLLAADGHHVIARDLPGNGLRARLPRSYLERPFDPARFATEPSPAAQLSAHDYAGEVIETISQLAERMPGHHLVLVGHSFMGLTLSRVAEAIPEHIGRLAYISALMPAPGKSFFDYLGTPEFAASEIPPLLVGDPAVTGALRIDFRSTDPGYQARIKSALAADVEDDEWRAVTSMVTPDIPTGPLADPAAITPGRWGAIPRTYISDTADSAIPAAAQRMFIEEADKLTPGNRTEVRELAASHCPFLSQPDQLASILLQL
jgi:pimeloyl-ACP methyl ester carboxylesterase